MLSFHWQSNSTSQSIKTFFHTEEIVDRKERDDLRTSVETFTSTNFQRLLVKLHYHMRLQVLWLFQINPQNPGTNKPGKVFFSPCQSYRSWKWSPTRYDDTDTGTICRMTRHECSKSKSACQEDNRNCYRSAFRYPQSCGDIISEGRAGSSRLTQTHSAGVTIATRLHKIFPS